MGMDNGGVLLFGFEPFLQFKENPSWKIVKALDGKTVGGRKITGRILPVDYGMIEQLIVRDIEEHDPSVVIGTGLAAGRSLLSVEKIAVNYKHSEEPDNKGRKEEGGLIDGDAPDGMFSNLSPEESAALLNRAGIPAAVSLSAGAYLCNFAMFIITRESRKRGFTGGFVHVPCDEEMASKHEYRRFPFMSLESMKKGITIIIENALKGKETDAHGHKSMPGEQKTAGR